MVQNRAVAGCGVGAAAGRPDPKGRGNVRSRHSRDERTGLGPGWAWFLVPPTSVWAWAGGLEPSPPV